MTDIRSSVFPAAWEAPTEASTRGSFQSTLQAAPQSGHYSGAQVVSHLRSATSAAASASMHQTPVPIPHPAHHVAHAPSHMPIRPIHYQHTLPQQHPHQQHQLQLQQQSQVGYVPNYPSAVAGHQQTIGTPTTAGSSSQVQLSQPGRAPFASALGNATPHVTVYNPPRTSEVYTLADGANNALPPTLRQTFQRDEVGRVLFFTAPPLDRFHKGLSSGSAGLGHSIRYLAGRRAWLAERNAKRKLRNEAADRHEVSQKCLVVDGPDPAEEADSVAKQATSAVNEWFRQFDNETRAWRGDNGLEE